MPEQVPRLRLLSAGSFRAALTELADGWPPFAAHPPEMEFGPAGFLRERIEAGEAADLFLSANMEHPRTLAAARHLGDAARHFAGNRMVAIARRELGLTTGNFLEILLADTTRIGTSTPKLDPSGDYAFRMFELADPLSPGAGKVLAAKAMQLVGGRVQPEIPAGQSAGGWFIANGTVDVFLSYRTNALPLAGRYDIVEPPAALAIAAEYGLLDLAADPQRREGVEAFVEHLFSEPGRRALARYGFSLPGK